MDNTSSPQTIPPGIATMMDPPQLSTTYSSPSDQQQNNTAVTTNNNKSPRQLWPNGVGISDRYLANPGDKDLSSCSAPRCCGFSPCIDDFGCLCMLLGCCYPCLGHCGLRSPCYCCSTQRPPFWCCSRPVWFYDSDFRIYDTHNNNDSQQQKNGHGTQKWSGCCTWYIDDANVGGTRMSFEGRERCCFCCCGVENCCEPELHVKNATTGAQIGKVSMLKPCCIQCNCMCCQTPSCIAKDAQGNPKFGSDDSAAAKFRWSGDMFGWQQYRWPVRLWEKNAAIANIVLRYHACSCRHPVWVGVENMSSQLSEEDQQLLFGLAMTHWWRSTNEGIGEYEGHPA